MSSRMLSGRNRPVLPALVLFSLPHVVSAQPFFPAVLPSGVAADPSGNVYIASVQGSSGSMPGTPIITKLSSTGKQMYQLPINPLLSEKSGGAGPGKTVAPAASSSAADPAWAAGRLIYDDTLGTLWYLSPEGQLLVIDPADGASALFVDVPRQNFDSRKTIDIGDGTAKPFLVDMSLQQAKWGDLEVIWFETARPGAFEADFFLTGVAARVHFVARVRFAFTAGPPVQIQPLGNDIAVASRQLEASPEVPGGIGIDFLQGNVYTTLPIVNASGSPEHMVSFSSGITFSKNAAITIDDEETSSRGITTDQNGNIYIATGTAGTSVCTDPATGDRLPGGTVLMRRPDGTARCFYFDQPVPSQDVAISPDGNTAYLTLGLENQVVTLDIFAPADATAAQSATESNARFPVRTKDVRGELMRLKKPLRK